MHIIKNNLFPTPPLFDIIKKQSGTSWDEMYKVFNMGHRFEIYVQPEFVQDIINISNSFAVDAQVVGRVEESKKKKLTITDWNGTYEYR